MTQESCLLPAHTHRSFREPSKIDGRPRRAIPAPFSRNQNTTSMSSRANSVLWASLPKPEHVVHISKQVRVIQCSDDPVHTKNSAFRDEQLRDQFMNFLDGNSTGKCQATSLEPHSREHRVLAEYLPYFCGRVHRCHSSVRNPLAETVVPSHLSPTRRRARAPP